MSKHKAIRRFLGIFLAVVMVFTLWTPIPVAASTKKSHATTEIQVGESTKLRAYGYSWRTTWKSSDENIVTVKNDGTITGINPGEATVTASLRTFGSIFTGRERTEEFNIVVVENDTPESETIEVNVGETVSLDKPSNGRTTWRSSDTSVATVSSSGTVTGISAGNVTITATMRTGGFNFWFIHWGGKTTTTEYYITVVDNGETPEPGTYTVIFESNGGSEVENQTVKEGQKVSIPDNPTRVSYIFTGWYSDRDLQIGYDFDNPVTSDLTLYAGWDSSAIDEEEYRTDGDNDSVSDAIEEIYGLDKNKTDTDGDGLSDVIEIEIGYDGTKVDTNENGVLDGDEDADNDGLANAQELELGTDLAKSDTDEDGLLDSDEINTHGTDPLVYDTDQDGVNDGYEVQLGTDPLVFTDTFQISKKAISEDDNVSAFVDIELSGEQVDSLKIEAEDNSVFFPQNMPGYLGKAYNFSVEGDFEYAIINFEFDSSILENGSDPAIFYFNEESQTLEELPTSIEGNVASAAVNHFSKYILLDRTIYYNSFSWQDVWDTEGTFNGVEIALTIDDSGSLGGDYGYDSNTGYFLGGSDPEHLRLTAARNLVENSNSNAKIGIVKFDSTVDRISEMVTCDDNGKEMLKNMLQISVSDSSSSVFNSKGGTNMYTGIETALETFTPEALSDASILKAVVVFTDGMAQDSGKHNEIIESANNLGVRIYTVGLGSESSYFTNYLQPLAEKTGGSFYSASNADQLNEIFESIGMEIDLETDSDGDGIPDYYEDHMIAFNGTKIQMDKNNRDTDRDGLPDGEEVEVELIYNADQTKVYVKGKLLSDPTLEDSDYDGINDSQETDIKYRLDNDFSALMHYSVGETLLQDLTQQVSYYNSLVDFTFDYRDFFKNNTTYSKNLSILGCLFALDMYDAGYLDFDGYYGTDGKSNMKDNTAGDGVTLAENFGLQNVENYSKEEILSISDHPTQDEDDVTEFTVGHRKVTYNNESMEIIFLTLRGTDGSNAEWSSNFDVGANSNEYINRTGTHDDWSNKENHKGFDVAATRVLKAYDDYLEKTGLKNDTTQKCIFIAGHSRAAAIANILGTHFERDTAYKSFVYTFATPLTTEASDTSTYSTIFNIVNTDDIVTCLPLEKWGFSRYGITKKVSVKDSYENVFDRIFIRDYNSNGLLSTTIKAFEDIDINNREDLYVLDDSNDGTVWVTNKYHVTYTGAAEEEKKLEEEFTNEKLLKYCKLSIDETLIGYYVACNYCPAYFLQTLANMTVKPVESAPTLGRDVKGAYALAKAAFVGTSGKLFVGGMANPHMPPTYYIIAKEAF